MKSFIQFTEESAAGVPANAVGDGSGVKPLVGDPPKRSKRSKLLKRPILAKP